LRRLIVDEWMSLDGVIQAPIGADEDRAGGFVHGGWHARFFDDLSRDWVAAGINAAGGFVLGRRTYLSLASYWPHASVEEQIVAQPLNTLPKYVASTTLHEPLAWQNSRLLRGDLAAAVAALKDEDGADLHVIGSSGLVHKLAAEDLIDEYRLMVDPVLLGGGKRAFHDDGRMRLLRLVDCRQTSTGALLLTYTRVDSDSSPAA
jgi:dihydrofolate reductase